MSLVSRIRKAKRVYIVGNGGSHANAEHIANDLLAAGVRAFTINSASLTATANDMGYEKTFSRWIQTVGERGDLLIALSGSGRSPNVLNAIKVAKRLGMDTKLVTDYLKYLDMQQSEEAQLVLGHHLMRELRKRRGKK
jgi:D-sedoheptulose 7-phosphate isomerase